MRALGAVALFGLALAGCINSQGDRSQVNRLVVAADEPEAAVIGRQILLEGGNAADAATAMALTMTVTLPSRVGLGGGGVCLVHDPDERVVRALDFMPQGGAGAGAVPGLLRGLFALHAEYGILRWEALVANAEAMARLGHSISRALAVDLARAWPLLRRNRAASARFGIGGAPLPEGGMIAQPGLGEILSQIRTGGINTFYRGALAEQIVAASRRAGLGFDLEALGLYRPVWREPLQIPLGDNLISFAPQDTSGGAVHLAAWNRLGAGAAFSDATGPEERALIVSDALALDSLPSRGAASFAAGLAAQSSDRLAVVCGFTQNGLFGSGVLDDAIGSFAVPALDGRVQQIAGLAMLTNPPRGQMLVGLTAGGMAPALAQPLAELAFDDGAIVDALDAGRVVINPAGPGLLAEDRLDTAVVAGLSGVATVSPVEAVGQALGLRCRFDGAATRCIAGADPRGHGLAFSLER